MNSAALRVSGPIMVGAYAPPAAGARLAWFQAIDPYWSRTNLCGPELDAIIDSMGAQLIVRNLEPEIVEALRQRAARHGRSAEAEHREILRAALLPRPRRGMKELLIEMPDVGSDDDFVVDRRADPRELDL